MKQRADEQSTVHIKTYVTKVIADKVTDHTRNFEKIDEKTPALLHVRLLETVVHDPKHISDYRWENSFNKVHYST